MDKYELMELITDKINEVFEVYETANGIESGDITPLHDYTISCHIEKIADIIIDNFQFFGYNV